MSKTEKPTLKKRGPNGGARPGAGRDAFEAWYRMRKQYFLEYPAFCARLDGITGQSLVVQRAAGS